MWRRWRPCCSVLILKFDKPSTGANSGRERLMHFRLKSPKRIVATDDSVHRVPFLFCNWLISHVCRLFVFYSFFEDSCVSHEVQCSSRPAVAVRRNEQIIALLFLSPWRRRQFSDFFIFLWRDIPRWILIYIFFFPHFPDCRRQNTKIHFLFGFFPGRVNT